ncbi:MAG: hypothetical protein IPP40_14860 [bacterium]|nr:hypothetical protein [bacterium]
MLTQEVDRLVDAEPVHLDDSPVPPPLAYYFQSITVKLHVANGQKFQSINGPEYENGLSNFYQKVADGYLTAGVGFGYSVSTKEWCLPTLSEVMTTTS